MDFCHLQLRGLVNCAVTQPGRTASPSDSAQSPQTRGSQQREREAGADPPCRPFSPPTTHTCCGADSGLPPEDYTDVALIGASPGPPTPCPTAGRKGDGACMGKKEGVGRIHLPRKCISPGPLGAPSEGRVSWSQAGQTPCRWNERHRKVWGCDSSLWLETSGKLGEGE